MKFFTSIDKFKLVLFVILTLATTNLAAQIDYYNYVPLKASGKMPSLFRQSTEEKIIIDAAVDRSEMSEKEELLFLEQIHR